MDLANATPKQIEEFYSKKDKSYYKKFTTNQLRNFFSEIVSIRTYYRSNPDDTAKIELRLRKLKAMLVYAEGRQTGRTNLRELRNDVFNLIDSVLGKEGDFSKKLETFFDIMEGIVAYHKFYEEGRNLN